MRNISSRIFGVCLCAFVLLGSCTSDLLETIEEDIADQREKEALEEEEGKTAETRKPVITLFAWQNVTGGTTNNPTVGCTCAAEAKAVSTAGAATIAGYYLSQTATAPAVDAAGWVAAQPESFAFPPENGVQTVYLWVKDSFGNVSDSSPLSITLAPLSLSWNAFYVDGMMVPAHEVFLLSAAEPLSTDDASVSGAGSGTVTLSGTGLQTITVSPTTGSPAPHWTAGTQTLTVSVKTAYGLTATLSRDFSIFNGVCVSSAGTSSAGTARQPVSTIPAGITRAQVLYSGAGEVRISQGEYTTNWNGNNNRITLIDGISLYGGYNTAWTAREVNGYPVVIRDESSGGGTTAAELNRAIDIPDSITDITFVDGVSVYGGGGEHSTAIFSAGSPKIENCKLYAGSTGGSLANDAASGFYALEGSPELTGCTINIGDGGSSSVDFSYGIQVKSLTEATISGCRISGGTAVTQSTGIIGGDFLIEKNEIDGGFSNSSVCISVNEDAPAVIRNNIIRTGTTQNNGNEYGIYLYLTTNCGIRNNTFIVNGTNGKSFVKVYGIFCDNPSGTIIENCLMVCEEPYGSDVYGVYKGSFAGEDPTSMSKNGFSGFTNPDPFNDSMWLYAVDGGDSYTQSELGLLNGLSFVTSENMIGTANLDSDYRLTSTSSEEFQTMGLDGDALGWGFSDDYSGQARTGDGTEGWSIGCYEY